jgi:nicotinamidase/pyrazinamidase
LIIDISAVIACHGPGNNGEVFSMASREALLVIDMLNDFVLEGAPLEVPDTRNVRPVIREEIDRARQEGSPVIFVCDNHEPDDVEFEKLGWPPHAVGGTEGAKVVKELEPAAGETVIKKTTYDGFFRTGLDETLKSLKVTNLRLTGCVTHICILFTASAAVLRGYHVSVVEGGVAGLEPQDHEAALRIMKNVLSVTLL